MVQLQSENVSVKSFEMFIVYSCNAKKQLYLDANQSSFSDIQTLGGCLQVADFNQISSSISEWHDQQFFKVLYE